MSNGDGATEACVLLAGEALGVLEDCLVNKGMIGSVGNFGETMCFGNSLAEVPTERLLCDNEGDAEEDADNWNIGD